MNKDNVNKATSEGVSRSQKKTKEEIIRGNSVFLQYNLIKIYFHLLVKSM